MPLLLLLILPGLFLIVPEVIVAQTGSSHAVFRSPVDFPIFLSGSFGEIRSNHFHSGIDIRTGGVTGKPVYAVSDGYISRIFVSPYGFGKALYISHPSGYTSVYAHLDSFAGEIGKYVRQRQYTSESFAIDEAVETGRLQVRKGEIVGYSGNSGSSGGPHLHFEIRDLKTQEPLDPVSYGIPVTDNLPPQIRTIRVLPADPRGMVNFSHQPRSFKAAGASGTYRLETTDTITLSGNIIFAIEAYDYHNGSSIRCGIRRIELKINNQLVFGQQLDRFSFSDTRYVNAILDYPTLIQTKQRFQRSWVAPGNTLDIFYGVVNRGMLSFSQTGIHIISYTVWDGKGNHSSITFPVKSHPPPQPGREPWDPELPGTLFSWDQPNRYETPGMTLDLPEGTLYEDTRFQAAVLPAIDGVCSSVYQIHTNEVPLHRKAELTIRNTTVPRGSEPKAVVVRLDDKNRKTSLGGTWHQGSIQTTIREFGRFAVALDTIPPKITPVNLFQGKKLTSQKTLTLKISDDLSGVSRYRGTLNGKWILMDYDGKTGTLSYRFDERLSKGENLFRLEVTDGCGNRSICEYKLFHVGL